MIYNGDVYWHHIGRVFKTLYRERVNAREWRRSAHKATKILR